MDKPVTEFGKVIRPIKKEKKQIKMKIKPIKINTTLKAQPITLKKGVETAISCVFGYLCGSFTLFGNFNPVGIACLTAYFGRGTNFYFVCMSVFLGYITSGVSYGLPVYIIGLCSATATDFLITSNGTVHSPFINAVKGSLCTLMGAIVVMAFTEISSFLVFRWVVEALAIIGLSLMFNTGIGLIRSNLGRRILDNDEIICIAVVFITVIGALSQKVFFGADIAVFFGTLLILVLGFGAGSAVAGATGAVLGLCLMLLQKVDAQQFLMFTVAGLLCGGFNKNRGLSALSFAIGIVIPAFYLAELPSRGMVVAMGLAMVIFLALPKKYFDYINTFANHKNEFDHKDYFLRLKDMTEGRLKAFATAFGTLAEVFDNSVEENEVTPKAAAQIIDNVADRVCQSCSMALFCWRTKSFDTYEGIHRLIGAVENNGRATEDDATVWLKNGCVRLKDIIDEANICTREHRNTLMWQGRLNQTRGLIKEQLQCVEKIIGGLGSEVMTQPRFYESMAKEIKATLLKMGIELKGVYVAYDEKEGFFVSIKKPQCFGNLQCQTNILPVINNVLGRHMLVVRDKCQIDKAENCTVTFKEERGFGFQKAVAVAVKDGSVETGDSYFADELKGKHAIMAVCDGMGSGEEAAKESRRGIKIIRSFLTAGFDIEMAVKVLNTALATGKSDDMYTTLDICSIDLYTGKGEVIKNGGATVFIAGNGKVKSIRSSSLPVGIMEDAKGEKTTFSLKEGDTVIMVTDGVTDALGVDNEGKIVEEAVAACGGSVDKLVQKIIEAAKMRSGGAVKDDMTVVAGRMT
ncbi:MAG: SpoIIE family protein phosphatase [Lachnospiraceae bacterium]|nr:SpoIIE family protein phosphatase [Lachnospiraceae bacterium]